MDLHAKIMNLPCSGDAPSHAIAAAAERDAYKHGHRDARHAAAELVIGIAVELPDDGELEAWRSTADELLRFPLATPATIRRAAHLLQNAYLFASKMREQYGASEIGAA